MAKKKVTLEQFAAVLTALPGELERKTINGVRKAAARLVVLVEHEIRNHLPHPIVDRGRMVQSVLLLPTPTGAIVRVDAPYAPVMEFGARPFVPPLQPLLEWAARKGFEDPAGVANAIRWKFAKHGIAPKRFFAAALAKWKQSDALPREVLRALEERPK